MGFRMKKLIPIIAVLSSLMFSGCPEKLDQDGSASAIKPIVTVDAATVNIGNMNVTVEASGLTDVQRKEIVVSPIAGTILTINKLEGASVKAGDTLAFIESKESLATISGAEILSRIAKTPEQEQEAARALKLALSAQNFIPIVARNGGTISGKSVSEGDQVGENAELFNLVDLSSLDFIAEVPLKEAANAKIGQPGAIKFTALPGKKFASQVSAFNPQSDVSSQAVRVRLDFTTLSNEDKRLLKVGMAGTVAIVTDVHKNVLLVPRSALLRNDETNSYSVVSITSDSLSKTIAVQVGVITDSMAEVSGADLHAGESVITEGNYALSDSTRVRIAR